MQFQGRTGLNALILALLISCSAVAQTSMPLDAVASSSAEMTDAQVHAAIQKVKDNPDDVESRARLLGHYFATQDAKADIEARRAQIFWMIQHRPAERLTGSPFCQIVPEFDPDGYVAGKKLWTEQVDKPAASADVFGNAATFVMLHDQGAAEELLKRAQAAEPTDPRWPQNLAGLHRLPTLLKPGAKPDEKTDQARKALADYEKALALTKDPNERFYTLTAMPKTAFEAGDNAKAAEYAKKLLADAQHFKGDWNYGNAIHTANLTLGRIALAAGDIETAKARLLDAGKTPGSPQLDSFGPNMELARDLLQKGEKTAVLDYFNLCGKFWKMGAEPLASWKKTIAAGGTPDFGANLSY